VEGGLGGVNLGGGVGRGGGPWGCGFCVLVLLVVWCREGVTPVCLGVVGGGFFVFYFRVGVCWSKVLCFFVGLFFVGGREVFGGFVL